MITLLIITYHYCLPSLILRIQRGKGEFVRAVIAGVNTFSSHGLGAFGTTRLKCGPVSFAMSMCLFARTAEHIQNVTVGTSSKICRHVRIVSEVRRQQCKQYVKICMRF
jgi:hypothetical protein